MFLEKLLQRLSFKRTDNQIKENDKQIKNIREEMYNLKYNSEECPLNYPIEELIQGKQREIIFLNQPVLEVWEKVEKSTRLICKNLTAYNYKIGGLWIKELRDPQQLINDQPKLFASQWDLIICHVDDIDFINEDLWEQLVSRLFRDEDSKAHAILWPSKCKEVPKWIEERSKAGYAIVYALRSEDE